MQSAWLGAPLVLGVALWLRGAHLAVAGQPAGSQVCKSECAKAQQSKIPWQLLQSYKRTNCGKTAVILTTKRNRTFCANPADQWVQDAMLKLDAEKVDIPVPKEPGEFQKLLGTAVPMTTEARRPLYTTAAYGMPTTSVGRTEGPEPSAVNSTLVGPPTTKSSPPYQPEVSVSGTPVQPEPLANGSTVYFTEAPQTFEAGPASIGKGLKDISGTTEGLVVPPTPRGAVDDEYHQSPTQSTVHPSSTTTNLLKKASTLKDRLQHPSDGQASAVKQVTGKPTVGLSAVPRRRDFTSPVGAWASTGGSRDNSVTSRGDVVSARAETVEASLSTQAVAPSAEVPLTFLPGALAGYRSHLIAVASLGVILCVSLAVAGVYAKNHLCRRASPTETLQGLTFSKYDLQTGAYAMQVL